MEGPTLFKVILNWQKEDNRPLFPRYINDISVKAGIERLISEVEPFASPDLIADIHKYKTLAMLLPGKHIEQLNLPILTNYAESNRFHRKNSA